MPAKITTAPVRTSLKQSAARKGPAAVVERARPSSADGKPIAAVERALQVLSAFRTSPRLTLSELSKQTNLFKSTLLRILSTLERHGYVTRLGDGQYRIGGVVYELGSGYIASFMLEDVIKPALESLSEATGESAAFYVRSGIRRQCVFRVDSPQAVRHVILTGQILDLDKAATSLIFRRYENDDFRPSSLVNYENHCIATSGIGDSQTASVAAPIFDTKGFLGVMNVSGPVNRFTQSSINRFRIKLASTAARISSGLGGFSTSMGGR